MAGAKSRKTSLRSDSYAKGITKRGDKSLSQKESKEVHDSPQVLPPPESTFRKLELCSAPVSPMEPAYMSLTPDPNGNCTSSSPCMLP